MFCSHPKIRLIYNEYIHGRKWGSVDGGISGSSMVGRISGLRVGGLGRMKYGTVLFMTSISWCMCLEIINSHTRILGHAEKRVAALITLFGLLRAQGCRAVLKAFLCSAQSPARAEHSKVQLEHMSDNFKLSYTLQKVDRVVTFFLAAVYSNRSILVFA